MSFADHIHAAEELHSIYTEWKINPNYPEYPAGEFDKVMLLVGKFIQEA